MPAAASVTFFALFVIAVPIVVLVLLGLILAIIRPTRVAGVTLLVILALLLLGGATLLIWLRASSFQSAIAAHDKPAEVFEPHYSDTLGDDGAPVSIDLGDSVPPPDSTGLDQPAKGEVEPYPDESGRVAPLAGADRPTASSASDVVPAARPKWVGEPAFAQNQVDYLPVSSGPYVTRGECRRALYEAMKKAVDEYVADDRGRAEAARYVGVDLEYIRTHLQEGAVYEETVQASFGPMRQQHALLKFGREFQEEMERRWNQVVVTSRLAQVALVLVAVLAGLGTLFAYFRLDTATKGYYSGRLQLAAGTVILGWVALGILVAHKVPWL